MGKNQEDFLRELLADFKIEAEEHYQAIVNGLLFLEQKPDDPQKMPVIEKTFREVHSLKGAARAVNLIEIERLCQSIEGVFHALKDGKDLFSPFAFDVLHKAVDALYTLLNETDKVSKSIGANSLAQLMRRLDGIQKGEEVMHSQPIPVKPAVVPQELPVEPETPVIAETQQSRDTVRISIAKLEKLLVEAEEFLTMKSALRYQIDQMSKSGNKEIDSFVRNLEKYQRQQARMIDDLLLDIKTTLLLPFGSMLEIVPKIVRDLAHSFGKEVNLTIRGAEIEIDRRILEEMKDPLIHLIRNCIDHGIETIELRERQGKSSRGNIGIGIRQESGSRISMTIHDDGSGINREKLIASSIKAGHITQEQADKMSDNEILSLIFKSGVSTSPFITDISGRGLGMAIVSEKVSKLGGKIQISSGKDQGTTFIITLPVTLATFKGTLIRVGNQLFVVPVSVVERGVRIQEGDLKSVEGKSYFYHNQENISVNNLADILGVSSGNLYGASHWIQLLLISWAQKRFAFLVDEIIGEQEGTVKNLGPQLLSVRHISGAIIMGNGGIVPILNIPDIVETALESGQRVVIPGTVDNADSVIQGVKKILVAEDSITLRALLRNIIESEGYQVKTAVDGAEAFLFLQEGDYDLVVSDVEMPRMNGFELTRKIRDDKHRAELPVILVTALDSFEDRQRGMEAGASAYIVKGSFEQSNLLDTIKRLI